MNRRYLISRARRRQQGGFVLIMVLLLVLVLTVTATILFERSNDELIISQAVRHQAIAAARASMGARRVIAESTSPNSNVGLVFLPAPAPPAAPQDCNPPACGVATVVGEDNTLNPVFRININTGTTGGLVEGPPGADLDQGGGMLYRAYAFRSVVNGTPKRYAVSFGYYGFNPQTRPGSRVYESMVMVEIAPPTPPASSTAASGFEGTG